MNIGFTTAATLSLEALADLFTRSFAEYFYPGVTTPQMLSRRLRIESIELLHSPVITVNGVPAGMALLARRGGLSWCGGFGITLEQRGKGLAHALAAELLAQARASGARRLSLEVLTRNTAALHVYQRAGLTITRRLLILSWRPSDNEPPAPPWPLDEADPRELVLKHFAAMHPVPAAWQRDAAALLVHENLRGLALPGAGGPRAYALVAGDVESMRIIDFAAADESSANLLLGSLKVQSRSLLSINEPAESPLTPAFLRAGFVTADEQHEMEVEL